MHRLAAAFVALTVPGLALASSNAHLLDHPLAVSLAATAGDAAVGEPTPPPPPPPVADTAPADAPTAESGAPSADLNLAPSEEAPGLGGVLGFMITGGVVTGTGAIFLLEAIAYLAAPASMGVTRSIASSTGITALVLGGIHLAIGIPLLVIGNSKRVARARWLDEHPQAIWLTPGSDGQVAIVRW